MCKRGDVMTTRVIPKWEDVNLSNNILFIKTMEDTEICRLLLQEILEVEIKEVKLSSPEKTLKSTLFSKGVRLDVYVSDDNNTVYDIEIQTTRHKNLAKRARYYQSSLDSRLIEQGDNYSKLNKSYIIFLCTFDPYKRNKHKYTIIPKCVEAPDLAIDTGSTFLFLNPESKENDVSKRLIGFLEYLTNSTDEVYEKYKKDNLLLQKTVARVKKLKDDKQVGGEYMTYEMKLREERQEAEEKGRLEERLRLAKKLLDLLDDETIAKTTDFTIDEVKALRKEVLLQKEVIKS